MESGAFKRSVKKKKKKSDMAQNYHIMLEQDKT